MRLLKKGADALSSAQRFLISLRYRLGLADVSGDLTFDDIQHVIARSLPTDLPRIDWSLRLHPRTALALGPSADAVALVIQTIAATHYARHESPTVNPTILVRCDLRVPMGQLRIIRIGTPGAALGALLLHDEGDLVWTGHPIPLRGKITIGKHTDNAISLPGQGLASHHATITGDGRGHWWITAEKQTSAHTAVNGTPVSGRHALVDGDRLELERHQLTFKELW